MSERTNLGDLIDRSARADADAVVDLRIPAAPSTLTFGALDARCHALARGLRARGLARGERVAIAAANRVELLIAYLGIMQAVGVAVPVNHRLPREAIAYILRDSQARLAFCDGERREQLPAGLPVIDFDDPNNGWESFLDAGPFEALTVRHDEIAMILYTSGSTGRPKGVPLTHGGHRWAVEARLRATPCPHQHTLVVAAPLFHMNGLGTAKFALAAHARLVLMPQFDARRMIAAVERHRITWLTAVPAMMAMIAREKTLLARTDLSSVRMIRLGSAPVSPALMAELRALFPAARITNVYGTTEAGPVAFGPHPHGIPRPDLALGYPHPEVGVRLVAGENRAADEGVLHLKTPALTPGYLNLPEKTREAITPDGWYVTGDVLRRDGDGFHYFVGRADDMFVCGGENIYPGEVEQILERHDGVEQACVVPVPDRIKGDKPFAFVVRRAGVAVEEQELKAFALARAPAYQHPRRVVFLDHLPLAATNKIDRLALAKRARELAGQSEPGPGPGDDAAR